MKHFPVILSLAILITTSCTSQKNLAYLSNLPETSEIQYFPMDYPDYKVQYRDILYITIKSMTADGSIEDLLLGKQSLNQSAYFNSESSQYITGYNVDIDGSITLPVLGKMSVVNKNISEVQQIIIEKAEHYFNHPFVECKLLSFKFTVLGEAKIPGTYINYNNYLTVLEAIGRAGGVGDYGRRDRVLVLRPSDDGTKAYRINLQDKNILTSEAYFLQPNDLVIIEPLKNKIFNMNLPTISFILATITSTISTTLLLISFIGSK